MPSALVTGCAGFIGSHLVDALIALDWDVVGVDDFSLGKRANIEAAITDGMSFVGADVSEITVPLRMLAEEVDVVFHLAAHGSVPRSISDPRNTHKNNVDGFLNVLDAVRESARRPRLVFASSSAVYGSSKMLPKKEQTIGRPLSPYAASKLMNEILAQSYASAYGIECVGLRFFNVFGPRQATDSAYAAVIPRWAGDMLAGRTPTIFGDGSVKRDFTPVDGVVEALVAAAGARLNDGECLISNVCCGESWPILDVFQMLAKECGFRGRPLFAAKRAGDIQISCGSKTVLSHRLGVDLTLGRSDFQRKLREVVNAKKNACGGTNH